MTGWGGMHKAEERCCLRQGCFIRQAGSLPYIGRASGKVGWFLEFVWDLVGVVPMGVRRTLWGGCFPPMIGGLLDGRLCETFFVLPLAGLFY